MLQARVQQIVDSVGKLRPMPTSVTRILKEIDSPYTTITTISEYIGLDQALAALVLQLANSVSMGYTRTCSSLREAVVRIGLKRLKSILLAAGASASMQQNLYGYRLGSGVLWNHSLATALACEKIAKEINYRDPEEAYVSGLLHDIGKLLLDQYVLNDYTQFIIYIRHYQLPLWKVEEKMIGINHATVGGLMGIRWSFPQSLVDAIRFHHSPSFSGTNPTLPAIVNLGNSIAGKRFQKESELFDTQVVPETLEILQLSLQNIEELAQTVEETLDA
jgi:putative nucleotidyltransferase with HDIG domain